jgi:uncharacterized protein YaaQ
MKMVMAIIEDSDSNQIMRALHEAGFPLTLIDTTGGFLRQGKSTIIAGVADDQVDTVVELINQECSHCANPFVKRATLMVFNVDHFEQIS